MSESRPSDIIEHVSSVAFEPRPERLTAAIAGAGMSVFARIDHAASPPARRDG